MTTATPKDETRHLKAEEAIQIFKYDKTHGKEFGGGVKKFVPLANTKNLRTHVQVLKKGGENNLHYHTNVDIMYMVLKGRVKFYGPEDKVYGEFGPLEGLVFPADARYWFEQVGAEELELFQVFAYGGKEEKDALRVNVGAHKPWMEEHKELTIYESN